MISGKVGMTRKTLVISERTSSAMPPRYAAETPTSTDSTVAKKPGHERDDQRLPGAVDELGEDVLAERGRAEQVASPDGPRNGSKAYLCGSWTEVNSCGAMASTQKTRKMTRPTMALRLASSARQNPPRRRRCGVGAPAGAVVVATSAVIGAYPFARARGSSQAIAKSQSSTATSTATVNSMNSTCISG